MKKYCRIKNDAVKEWNITEKHISNRGHSIDDYVEIMQILPPEVKPWEELREVKPQILNGRVYQNFEIVEMSVDNFKKIRLTILKKETEKALEERPEIDTGLGFSVEGGYRDLINFDSGKKMGLNKIRDSQNKTKIIDPLEWDTIIGAIRNYGLKILQSKWDTEDLINAATTHVEVAAIKVYKPWERVK